MNEIILSTVKLNELELLIDSSVRKAIKEEYSVKIQQPANSDLLNVKQASELLGLAVPTIYALTSNRTLPHSKRGKRLYFNKSELLAWVQSGKRKTTSDLKLEASKK